jgi:secondary thiamine-phosphate synthase enzyme
MSKSSTVTARENPMADRTSVSGSLVVHADTLTIETESRFQLVDITDRAMAIVRGSGVSEGVAHVLSLHTTCSVLINESQAALVNDIKRFLEHVVDRDADWMHNDPEHSDCDRFNADAHLRSLLLGPTLTLQVSRGEVVLGQWQRVLLAELDGPRARSLRVQVMGVGQG